jgi:hypothetical protein
MDLEEKVQNKVRRGRPRKEKEEEIIVEKKPVGRPRTINITNIKEYHKLYYEKNKEKTKGDYLCENCNLYCSKSNKSRHIKNCVVIR